MIFKKIKNLQILDLEFLQLTFHLFLLIIPHKDILRKLIMDQEITSIIYSVISIAKYSQLK